MQATIFAIVCKRLIAGVDDRPIKLHPLVDIVHDVIGTLADLKVDATRPIRHFEIERERICLSNASSPGENLTRREKGKQRTEYFRSKLGFPVHKIILMAAEGSSGVVIDIVF